MARHSREDFSTVGSLDMISRRPKTRFETGFPASGSPEWWALRKRYEELLFTEVRRLRASSCIPCKINHSEAEAARWAALGNEAADRDYQSFVKSIGPNTPPRRKDWLHAASEAIKRADAA